VLVVASADSPSSATLPFPRAPAGIARRQVLFLDALELGFAPTDVGYERLKQTLAPSDRSFPEALAFFDVWGLVDTLNRLRAVTNLLPGLKRTPAVESFLRSLAPIEDPRNAVQHQYNEVDRIKDTRSGGASRGLVLLCGKAMS
jgi:hypothetical protein